MTIQELCVKHPCDKGLSHSYAEKYDELFPKLKDVKTVLEIGIGYPELMTKYINWREEGDKYEYKTGASLYVWRDYFPRAQIIGIDNNDLALKTMAVEDRIAWYRCDQGNEVALKRLAEKFAPFDLIVDDGSHNPQDQLISAKALLPHMRKGGMYFIEDVYEPGVVVLTLIKHSPILFEWGEDSSNDKLIYIQC